MLARLRHPNVCLFMGASFDGTQWAIVTELVDGSLWDAIHDAGIAFSKKHQAHVALGIARGLAYLHAHTPPVLHRDIKSPNVLVDAGFHAVKLCDVGLAREAAAAATMTVGCGTPQWMAPEVLNAEQYGAAADVYSFGIVVAELLTRQCPYADHPDLAGVALALRVVHDGLRPTLPPGASPLADLAQRCWVAAPLQRPRMDATLPLLERLVHEARLTE